MKNAFTKSERLCSHSVIEWLFDGKGRAYSAYPLRVVYKVQPAGDKREPCLPQILISVSKKKFRKAVDRNRTKRLIREAYRCRKAPLVGFCSAHGGCPLTLALIFTGNALPSLGEIERSLDAIFSRIVKSLEHEISR